ncbi:MAG: hypothetical protein BWY83_01588 [bacterium ADurb.Bin478]|nr:MAG: hypothetical protein BWY83_01588 [bacterium ADurb.Bin478]
MLYLRNKIEILQGLRALNRSAKILDSLRIGKKKMVPPGVSRLLNDRNGNARHSTDRFAGAYLLYGLDAGHRVVFSPLYERRQRIFRRRQHDPMVGGRHLSVYEQLHRLDFYRRRRIRLSYGLVRRALFLKLAHILFLRLPSHRRTLAPIPGAFAGRVCFHPLQSFDPADPELRAGHQRPFDARHHPGRRLQDHIRLCGLAHRLYDHRHRSGHASVHAAWGPVGGFHHRCGAVHLSVRHYRNCYAVEHPECRRLAGPGAKAAAVDPASRVCRHALRSSLYHRVSAGQFFERQLGRGSTLLQRQG